MIIGNISLVKKSATPLRKQSLNDLSETLPRAGDKRAQELAQAKRERQQRY
ncbi:hypothetical protein [Thalassotalea maritima]|uniref:hypothetical protein n=1 Tax=Thalassotalea maritima TaxID=3242416 RepID=UPI0035275BFA